MSQEDRREFVEKKTPIVEENFDDDALQQSQAKVESEVMVDDNVAKRQAIYEKSAEANKNGGRGEQEDDEPDNTQPTAEEEEPGDDTPTEPDDTDAEEEDTTPPKQVKVKIYGQERLVDKAVVDAAGGIKEYQKQVAASEKAQVERDRQFIEQESQRLKQERLELERLKKASPSQDTPEKTDLPSDDQAAKKEQLLADLKAAGESLLDGDVEEYTKRVAQYLTDNPLAKNRSEPVDIDSIVNQVEQRTIQNMTQVERQRQLSEARDTFFVEYPDLASDGDLYAKVDRRTVILQEEFPDKSPTEIVRLAAQEVRKVYGTERATPPPSTRADKIASKRAISKPSGGSTVATPPPEPQPETASDYVAKLREQRGQG